MAQIQITTKHYIALMRCITAAQVLDEHVAGIRGDKGDEELAELWGTMMDYAEDFGMSFPPEDPEAGHWSNDMADEADQDIHALIEDEFWFLLAQRMAEAAHAKTCDKQEGMHDEACFADVQERAKEWEGKGDKLFAYALERPEAAH